MKLKTRSNNIDLRRKLLRASTLINRQNNGHLQQKDRRIDYDKLTESLANYVFSGRNYVSFGAIKNEKYTFL